MLKKYGMKMELFRYLSAFFYIFSISFFCYHFNSRLSLFFFYTGIFLFLLDILLNCKKTSKKKFNQQTIENEFHVAMSAEKSTTQPTTSSSSIKTTPTTSSSITSPLQEQQHPFKPPRQKYKIQQQQQVATETTIDNLDDGDEHNDVSLWISLHSVKNASSNTKILKINHRIVVCQTSQHVYRHFINVVCIARKQMDHSHKIIISVVRVYKEIFLNKFIFKSFKALFISILFSFLFSLHAINPTQFLSPFLSNIHSLSSIL